MRRRHMLLSALLVPLASLGARAQVQGQVQAQVQSQSRPPLSAQDQADITRVEAYLNDLHSLKARFLQVAPDGRTTEGDAWLERPGRMRFEYKTAPFRLIANHGLLVFMDRSLAQTSNIPLGRTPLGILLADQVRLSGDVTVTSVQRQPGQLQITMVRTSSPGDGTLSLVFSDPPLALRQWIVLDAQRQETKVTLYDVQRGGKFDQTLFDVLASPYEPNRG